MKLLRVTWAMLCVALLCACAGLPQHVNQAPSQAIALDEAAQTTLGKIAQTSLTRDGANDSGFQLLPVGPSALDARLALIARAEKSVDAQYYLLQKDGAGLVFMRALRAAALRGVRVRLLVDDLFTIESEVVLRTLAQVPQVEVRLFNPFVNGRFSNTGRFLGAMGDLDRVNHRMHNKLLVVDNALSISGGRNIADEYFNNNLDSNFLDLDVLSAGNVVAQLSSAFDLYWNSDNVYPVQSIAGPASPEQVIQGTALMDGAALPPAHTEATDAATPFTSMAEPLPPALVRGRLSLVGGHARVLADSPGKVQSHMVTAADLGGTVNQGVLEVLEAAKHEVIMMSPYFVPQQRHLDNLRFAISHGVRVVVITNSIGSTDEPLVYAAYAKRRKAMLEMGVQLYEVNPEDPVRFKTLGDFRSAKGGLHAKVALMDQERLFVGSMNLDARSAVANTELGMIIDSPALTKEVLRMMRSANVSFHLRLSPAGEIEWVEHENGQEIVHTTEPNLGFWARLKLFFLSPLVSERLL